MDFQKFLEEYNALEIETLSEEQLLTFREIFFENGELDKVLEISKTLYERDPAVQTHLISYMDTLLKLNKKDDALFVLYNAETTAITLFFEGLIYKEDYLFDVAEEKFKSALEIVEDDIDLKDLLEYELANVYTEVGRSSDALRLSLNMFEGNQTQENYENLLDNLLYAGEFEDAIELHREYGKKFISAHAEYAVAYAYNQLEEFEQSKNHLLATIELEPEFNEAYMHLGFLSRGEEAIKYLEKYLELQGTSPSVYIQLTSLYREAQEYDKIRSMVRNVLKEMGIDYDSLYIAINALRNLYETDKIYTIYNEHDIIKDDANLLAMTLLALSEEEDYIDFVAGEIKKHHPFLREEAQYYEVLRNVYDLTGDEDIVGYIAEIDARQHGNYYDFHPQHHSHNNCNCGGHNHDNNGDNCSGCNDEHNHNKDCDCGHNH